MDNYLVVTGSRTQTLIDVFRALNTLSDEARIFFNPDGVKHSAMDPSHVAMVDLDLPSDYFDAYRFSEPHAVTFNLKDALKILKGTNKNDELTLVLEEGRLLFSIRDYTRDGAKPRAVDKRVPLLDDIDEETPTPKIFFKSSARIFADSLKETLKDMKMVSDVMSVNIDGDILHIGAHGDYFSADSEYERGADDLLEIRADEPSLSAFTIDYISNIVNTTSKLSEVIEIQLSNNMPIKISAELPCGRIDFYAAPCRESDGSSSGGLGAESVQWDPKPTLVYQLGDTPIPVELGLKEIPEAIPEPVPVDVEDPMAQEVPAELPVKIPAEIVIEEPLEAPAIDSWTLREARAKYYLNNPGVYETPTPEQLTPYLEGAA